ncbi:MAG: Quinolinate synthase A [Phycisphaerae bacterium]|nr:Quinolinate synthase A [Phycisphaerae bacterium]
MTTLSLTRPAVDPSLDLEGEIRRLKDELHAVILAHYYQEDEIQDIADFIGDSLALAQYAAKTSAEVIVFCGVHFMAETAKILNPDKQVLLPDLDAGCSLADRCPAPDFAAFLRRHPGHFVVSYINCSAAVKALSDVICTSSNAVKIVQQIPADRPIIFAPDRHLGRWVMKQTGRPMVLWDGFCVVHEQFSQRRIWQLKTQHPRALVIAHPECEEAVLGLADHIGSTSSLLNFVKNSPHDEFIVVTEAGILHQMRKSRPEAKLIPAPPSSGCNCSLCPYMRLNTLEKLYLCMRNRQPEIVVDPEVAARARKAIELMLSWS